MDMLNCHQVKNAPLYRGCTLNVLLPMIKEYSHQYNDIQQIVERDLREETAKKKLTD